MTEDPNPMPIPAPTIRPRSDETGPGIPEVPHGKDLGSDLGSGTLAVTDEMVAARAVRYQADRARVDDVLTAMLDGEA